MRLELEWDRREEPREGSAPACDYVLALQVGSPLPSQEKSGTKHWHFIGKSKVSVVPIVDQTVKQSE